MEVLVTGGAGFIGSHLINALAKANYTVINIDELNDYYNPLFKQYNLAQLPHHVFYQGSICEEKLLEQVFKKHHIEKVVHLGARAGVRPSVQQPELYDQVNFGGTKKLVTIASKYNISQFIFGSTSAVYGNTTPLPFSEEATNLVPLSPYAQTKLAAEQLLYQHHQHTGLPTTILRFFTVYGERGRPDMVPYLFTEAVLHEQPINKFGDGSSSRDYTYIADIITGTMAAIVQPFDFEIINLGNHQAVSLNEFIATLESITDKSAQIVEQPSQSGEMLHTLADIRKAKQLLDFEPKTTLEQGLQKFVDWYRAVRL